MTADQATLLNAQREQADQAMRMLEFAISGRSSALSSASVSREVSEAINNFQSQLADPAAKPADGASMANFQMAFAELSALLAPVTPQSLADTSSLGRGRLCRLLGLDSFAGRFSIVFWIIAFVNVTIAILTTGLVEAYGSILDKDPVYDNHSLYVFRLSLEILTPFTYGAIGACAYLLKSLHEYSYKRSFDRNRISEYYNRILLGIIGGGCLAILAGQIEGESSHSVVRLSAAALGLIAGYNTDLLFDTIKRLSEALLPKINLTSIAKQLKPKIQSTDIGKLIEQYAAAPNPTDKKALLAIIMKTIGD